MYPYYVDCGEQSVWLGVDALHALREMIDMICKLIQIQTGVTLGSS